MNDFTFSDHPDNLYLLLAKYPLPEKADMRGGSHWIINKMLKAYKTEIMKIMSEFDFWVAKEIFGNYEVFSTEQAFKNLAGEPRWKSHLENIKSLSPDEQLNYIKDDAPLRYGTTYDDKEDR